MTDPALPRGTLAALITPFDARGGVDLGALGALVDWQLDQGVEGLVPCGTTGEASALTAAERAAVIGCVARRAPAGTCILAGSGSSSTAQSALLLAQARDAGATCALVVTPPYCRPTPAGLQRHYFELADRDLLPLLAYNVPSRSGCDAQPELLGRLAAHPRIVGVKEATGDLDRLAALRACAPHWTLLSGDDLTACAFNLMGGDGAVSVVANLAPKDYSAMVAAARRGAVTTARALHAALRPLMRGLFVETSPTPLKAALALLGRVRPDVRAPLAALEAPSAAHIAALVRAGGFA